jgi:hypothetical protein
VVGEITESAAKADRFEVGKSNKRSLTYAIDDDAGPRAPAFEIKQSDQKIKVKLREVVTGNFTPTWCRAVHDPKSVIEQNSVKC